MSSSQRAAVDGFGSGLAAGRDHAASLGPFDKGVPQGISPVPLADVAAQGWNVLRGDLPLPAAVIREDALDINIQWMRAFVEDQGVALAPHGKTTMAPALFDRQLMDGAWGITLSTPHQVATAITLGYDRIFIANQVIGRSAIRYLFDAIENNPKLELFCLIDSIALIEQIEAIAAQAGTTRRLQVLVEKGFVGGRTGCRTVAETVAVARRIARSPHLDLVGVEGFEGLIRGESLAATLDKIRQFLDEVVAVARCCDDEDLFGEGSVLLSAGGSAFFDLVAERLKAADLSKPSTVLLRSGCYITHDAGMYAYAFKFLQERAPHLFDRGAPRPALEIWGYVQSRPEPNLAIVAVGKRDISYDQPPVPRYWYRPAQGDSAPASLGDGHRVDHLDDQHCYVIVPDGSPLAVGDMVGFGISHPCLTFDKWRVIHMVNEHYDVTGSLRTYF